MFKTLPAIALMLAAVHTAGRNPSGAACKFIEGTLTDALRGEWDDNRRP